MSRYQYQGKEESGGIIEIGTGEYLRTSNRIQEAARNGDIPPFSTGENKILSKDVVAQLNGVVGMSRRKREPLFEANPEAFAPFNETDVARCIFRSRMPAGRLVYLHQTSGRRLFLPTQDSLSDDAHAAVQDLMNQGKYSIKIDGTIAIQKGLFVKKMMEKFAIRRTDVCYALTPTRPAVLSAEPQAFESLGTPLFDERHSSRTASATRESAPPVMHTPDSNILLTDLPRRLSDSFDPIQLTPASTTDSTANFLLQQSAQRGTRHDKLINALTVAAQGTKELARCVKEVAYNETEERALQLAIYESSTTPAKRPMSGRSARPSYSASKSTKLDDLSVDSDEAVVVYSTEDDCEYAEPKRAKVEVRSTFLEDLQAKPNAIKSIEMSPPASSRSMEPSDLLLWSPPHVPSSQKEELLKNARRYKAVGCFPDKSLEQFPDLINGCDAAEIAGYIAEGELAIRFRAACTTRPIGLINDVADDKKPGYEKCANACYAISFAQCAVHCEPLLSGLIGGMGGDGVFGALGRLAVKMDPNNVHRPDPNDLKDDTLEYFRQVWKDFERCTQQDPCELITCCFEHQWPFEKAETHTTRQCLRCQKFKTESQKSPLIFVYTHSESVSQGILLPKEEVTECKCTCQKASEEGNCEFKETTTLIDGGDAFAVAVKRYSFDEETKLPKKILKPMPYELELAVGSSSYVLNGFILHYGASAMSGHYTAVVRKVTDGTSKWYYMDDDKVVFEVQANMVLKFTKEVCVLFYARKSFTNPQGCSDAKTMLGK